ncbi:MAG: hypothetical protein AB2L18_03605 [Anaerolineaceae bacterium]
MHETLPVFSFDQALIFKLSKPKAGILLFPGLDGAAGSQIHRLIQGAS